ncbi:membrane protein [Candidatus Magnetobacterium bavaricum]|uniref:Membrane protein n=1 Tax=Candidatus Magnetobacterium bavaricum TaxID=29290 RepID=A0A0F3H004_9BACT|nr:membrane protein [Candidatus Magnetobacterium bavaricum]
MRLFISVSFSFNFFLSQSMCSIIPFLTALLAILNRFFSSVIIATICLCLAIIASNSCASASFKGRTSGLAASAYWAMTLASIRSVFANTPIDLAKSRICRGFTATTGSLTSAKAATTFNCKPPVASNTTFSTSLFFRRSMRSLIPSGLLPTVKCSLDGLINTSSVSFDTSIPTKHLFISITSHPRRCGFQIQATVRALYSMAVTLLA